MGWVLFIIGTLGWHIGMYGMFQKAGIEPWKALIPFYNTWCIVEKCRLPQNRDDHENDREGKIIERKNPQCPAGVKCAEIPRRTLGIEQDARNQKPGQDEEQIDAMTPQVQKLINPRRRSRGIFRRSMGCGGLRSSR